MSATPNSDGRVALGRTGLAISPIGFGAWAAGGDRWKHGWSSQRDEDSIAAITRAVELGVNWIDTAAIYGFGYSEEIVGRAIQGLADRPLLCTKCSVLRSATGIRHSLRRDSIRREIEGSLLRLQVDSIDLYQLHRPEPENELHEGWSTLAELRDEGVVRCIGISNVTAEQLRRLDSIAKVDALQPEYSLLNRAAERELLPEAERLGVGVIVYSPMASGLLTGTMTPERLAGLPVHDWRRQDARFAPARLQAAERIVRRLRVVAARHDVDPGQVAIAWTLRQPAVNGAIVGFRTAEQVDGLVRAGSLELSDEDIADIEAA
jgi:aryl-alcohol dehydrogenase-like predicted oxidoreductase